MSVGRFVEHNRPTPLHFRVRQRPYTANYRGPETRRTIAPTARRPAPRSSGEAIPVYPVRGADTSRGGAAGVEIRAEMGQEGVSAMANQGGGDREGDGVNRRGFLRCVGRAGQ